MFHYGEGDQKYQGRKGHDIYMDGYQNHVPRKRKIAKAARKWKAPTNKPKEFKFSANTDQSKSPEGVFMFGSAARKVPSHQKLTRNQVNTVKKPGRWSRFGKFKVETKKTQGTDHMGNTCLLYTSPSPRDS